MAKKKKKQLRAAARVGTCAYCGAAGVNTTDDHVFPESWHPDGFPPSQMLLVPSCSPCNHSYGRREERMFLPLVMMLPTDPRTSGLAQRAMRAADPAAGRDERDAAIRRRVGEALLRKTKIIPPMTSVQDTMWTRTGRLIGVVGETDRGEVLGTPVVEFGWENLEPVAIKFLRGCYFDVYGQPLPKTPAPWAKTAVRDPAEVVAQLAATPGAVTRGGFPFSFVMASTKPEHTLGVFVLWDQVVVWASNIQVPAAR